MTDSKFVQQMAEITEMDFNQLGQDDMPIEMYDSGYDDAEYVEMAEEPQRRAPTRDNVINGDAATGPQLLERAWLTLDLTVLYRQMADTTDMSKLKLLFSNKAAWTQVALALQDSPALVEYQVIFRGQLQRHFNRQEELRNKIRRPDVAADTQACARIKAQLDVVRQHIMDIIASSIEYKTMPASKQLQRDGFQVTYQELVELRKVTMTVLRENAEHAYQLGNHPDYVHPGVIAGWLDQPLQGVSEAIEAMKNVVGRAFEIEPPSRLAQAEESVYSNELLILSDVTAALAKDMIAETGCHPEQMAEEFANARTVVTEKTTRTTALKPGITFEDTGVSVFEAMAGQDIPAEFMESRVSSLVSTRQDISDEEMQVSEVRAMLSILKDDRNFKDGKKRPKGLQHTLDRLRLIETIQEELDEFCGTRVTKHSYTIGRRKDTLKVPRTDAPKTAQQILSERQAPSTLWVLLVRASAKDRNFMVVEYGRDNIVSEAHFAADKTAAATAQYGREAKVTFERW